MKRTNRIVLIPHCYFNQNSVVKNEARNQKSFFELLNNHFGDEISYIQMECPEFNVFKDNRKGVGKNDLFIEKYQEFSNEYALKLVDMIKDYKSQNVVIDTVVGIKGSPSCGVTKTCINNNGIFSEINDQGMFMEVLKNVFIENNLKIKFIELD